MIDCEIEKIEKVVYGIVVDEVFEAEDEESTAGVDPGFELGSVEAGPQSVSHFSRIVFISYASESVYFAPGVLVVR